MREDEHEDERERAREEERERAREEQERAHEERDRAREAERDARQQERDARRAERDARREERQRVRMEFRQHFGDDFRQRLGQDLRERINAEVRRGMHGAGFAFDFGDFGGREGKTEASETVEQRFEVQGMPKLRVSNVSGETEITVGSANEVFVRARKRINGWSEERARRLLENVEIRMEQTGDEIVIEPRLFQQERGWHELFRGGRVAVDFDIRVPRETDLQVRTVSGELSVTGTRGPAELQSVSGEISIVDVQGPLRLRSVSGDINATSYAGQIEVNSVSGEVEFERSRVRTPDVVTVSGDVEIEALYVPVGGPEGRIKTVSGDIELALADPDAEIDFKTVSGDAEVDGPARIEKQGRRDRRIVFGGGGAHLRVKTVSGDLQAHRAIASEGDTTSPEADVDVEAEPGVAEARAEEQPAAPAARDILERLAKGELSVDDAAAALDAARRS